MIGVKKKTKTKKKPQKTRTTKIHEKCEMIGEKKNPTINVRRWV